MANATLTADPPYARSLGYALAMCVMQSDLYPRLDGQERAECDEFIRRGQVRPSGEWAEVERIRDLPEVDEALLNFKDDCTGDNAAMIVRAVMRAITGVPPYAVAGADVQADRVLVQQVSAIGKTESLRWYFERMEPTGTLLAVEPDGTRHVVKPGDLNSAAGRALLEAMTRALTAGVPGTVNHQERNHG